MKSLKYTLLVGRGFLRTSAFPHRLPLGGIFRIQVYIYLQVIQVIWGDSQFLACALRPILLRHPAPQNLIAYSHIFLRTPCIYRLLRGASPPMTRHGLQGLLWGAPQLKFPFPRRLQSRPRIREWVCGASTRVVRKFSFSLRVIGETCSVLLGQVTGSSGASQTRFLFTRYSCLPPRLPPIRPLAAALRSLLADVPDCLTVEAGAGFAARPRSPPVRAPRAGSRAPYLGRLLIGF